MVYCTFVPLRARFIYTASIKYLYSPSEKMRREEAKTLKWIFDRETLTTREESKDVCAKTLVKFTRQRVYIGASLHLMRGEFFD